MNHPTSHDSSDDELDPRLGELLASPSVWAPAPPELAERVVEAIVAERAASGAERHHVVEIGAVDPVGGHRSRRTTSPVVLLAAAALVLVVAGVVAVGSVSLLRSDGTGDGVAVALAAAGPTRTATATAMVDTTPKGTKISLDASGLPPAEPGTYYHAWMVRGHERISAGTFHLRGGDGRVDLWCGIDGAEYTTLAVTLESVDGGNGGEYVLIGTIDD